MPAEAFVSLATNDDYAMGALALGRSLRDANTSKTLVLLVTNGVSPHARDLLRTLWDELVEIEELDSRDYEHLQLLNRPELGVTFTKLHAWRLTRFEKCVFLDADTLVLCNVDELFEREELSAAPDVGWPDCFNSGVFVFKPSLETFASLYELAVTEGSFDGGDQGLLNSYWSDWATSDIKYHLPFIYNVTPNMYYQYAPAYKRFGKNARIIHFIGPLKPWHHTYLSESDTVIPIPHSAYQHSPEHLLRWWRAYQATQPQPQYPTSVSPSQATGGDPMDMPTGGAGDGDHVHHSSSAPIWQHDQHQGQQPVHRDQHGGSPAPHSHRGSPTPHDQYRSSSVPRDQRSPVPHHQHRGSPIPHDQYRSSSVPRDQHRRSPVPHHQHRGSPGPRHHSAPDFRPAHAHRGTSPVPGHHTRSPSRAKSPIPRHTTRRSPVPHAPPAGARPTTPDFSRSHRKSPTPERRRSSSRESSVEPMVRRRQAWQKGEIDYLGADNFDLLIGPKLIQAPVDRRMAWQRGEIDYLGADSYETLIEQLIDNTLNMYIPDEEDDDEDIESYDLY